VDEHNAAGVWDAESYLFARTRYISPVSLRKCRLASISYPS